jgi:quinol monooxygenase YgiN
MHADRRTVSASLPSHATGEDQVYGLIGKITAVPGRRDELAEILAGVGSMVGCLSYIVAHDPSDPDGVWVTEVWESAEAHQDSLDLPEVQEVITRGRPLIAGFGHRFETSPIGGTDL